MIARKPPTRPSTRWLLEREVEDVDGPESKKGHGEQQPWWRVVCLTGVDYFSTLEAVMNLIRNGLGMRKAEDRRGAGQPENPHSNTVFTQVHNTL